MTRDEVLKIAGQHASRYTNRNYPNDPVMTFTASALLDFVASIRALLGDHRRRDHAVIRQALQAIEQGETFDHLDGVIAPALRSALARYEPAINEGSEP